MYDRHVTGPKLVLGDFNEWMRGLVTAMLSEKLNSVDLRNFHLRKRTQRTYPGVFPVLHLDHIYYAGQAGDRRHRAAAHAALARGLGSPAAGRGCADRIERFCGSRFLVRRLLGFYGSRLQGAGMALDGARVWLTGASSGIGEALVAPLVRRGARVAITARRTELLDRHRREARRRARGRSRRARRRDRPRGGRPPRRGRWSRHGAGSISRSSTPAESNDLPQSVNQASAFRSRRLHRRR